MPPAGPTSMTYTNLLTDLRLYAERGGGLDNAVEIELPRIINRAEQDLANRLKILGYLKPMIGQMTINQPVIAKPENYRSEADFNYGSGVDGLKTTFLKKRAYEYVRALYPDRSQLGAPLYFADYDLMHWLVAPAPNIAYRFEVMCWVLPDLLCPANETNYLTEFAPNLLLYQCQMGLEAFLKNDTRVTMWKAFADGAFSSISTEDLSRMRDRYQLRSTA